jgi:hypothetical protein
VGVHVAVLGEIATFPRDATEGGFAETGDDFEKGAFSTPGGAEDGGEMFLGESNGQLREEKLFVRGITKLEGNFLKFEHDGESVVVGYL